MSGISRLMNMEPISVQTPSRTGPQREPLKELTAIQTQAPASFDLSVMGNPQLTQKGEAEKSSIYMKQPQGIREPSVSYSSRHLTGKKITLRYYRSYEEPKTIILDSNKDYLIGRSEDRNDIVLPEPDVSRQHAKIQKTQNGDIILADEGSTTGTFLQMNRMKLSEGDLIEVGSSLIQIQTIVAKALSLTLFFIEGYEEVKGRKILAKHQTCIGRQTDLEISIPRDPTIHENHAIFLWNPEENGFILRAQEGDYFFWRRLAKAGEIGKQVRVSPGELMRFGSNTYAQIYEEEADVQDDRKIGEMAEDNIRTVVSRGESSGQLKDSRKSGFSRVPCMVCQEAKADTVLLLCKHNVLCLQCAKLEDKCPKCGMLNKGFS
eukprot:TRINITY_DN5624_c0_g1_i12.p1 TRINITY_DN5624_c0_g1~~TRINITY_DN5624_c0_g1_i12.p1  ORF type:complete len:377 (+),score=28.67 TRINITY_DN5624_c0_g1_i12:296-1426(+)